MGQTTTLADPTLRTITGDELLSMSHEMRGLPYEYDDALMALRGLHLTNAQDYDFVVAIERQLMARRALSSFYYLNL